MIVKNSTEDSGQPEIENQFITELNKQVGFNLKKSISHQIEIAKYFPNQSVTSNKKADNNTPFPPEYPTEFSIEENILPLAKAKQAYGFIDTQKYSGKTQRWQGYVVEANEHHFTAHLEDLTNPGTSEILEFDLGEVSPEDEPLVTIGAVFYFSIGYVMNSGQREKISVLRFKRLTEWTEEEFDRAVDRAKALSTKLKWD